MIDAPAKTLVAQLMTKRWLPRHDNLAKRLLTDEQFRDDVCTRLGSCGLKLLENPFSEYIAVGLADDVTESTMGQDTHYLSNTFELSRDAIALLVILWALLIIPKRQRQYAAGVEEEQQTSFFAAPRLIVNQDIVRTAVKFPALVTDFAARLGGKGRISMNANILKRHGFIQMRDGLITEGPLLDLAIDYQFMASRIIDGTLGDILSQETAQTSASEESQHV